MFNCLLSFHLSFCNHSNVLIIHLVSSACSNNNNNNFIWTPSNPGRLSRSRVCTHSGSSSHDFVADASTNFFTLEGDALQSKILTFKHFNEWLHV